MISRIRITLHVCPESLGFPKSDEIGYRECLLIMHDFVARLEKEAFDLRSKGVAEVQVIEDDCYFLGQADTRHSVEFLNSVNSSIFYSLWGMEKIRAILTEFNKFAFDQVQKKVAEAAGLILNRKEA